VLAVVEAVGKRRFLARPRYSHQQPFVAPTAPLIPSPHRSTLLIAARAMLYYCYAFTRCAT
jgi:hypothetical protein